MPVTRAVVIDGAPRPSPRRWGRAREPSIGLSPLRPDLAVEPGWTKLEGDAVQKAHAQRASDSREIAPRLPGENRAELRLRRVPEHRSEERRVGKGWKRRG